MAQKSFGATERRKFFRLMEEDVIACELFSFSGTDSRHRKHVFSKSLSEGGLLFESDDRFELGALLKLEIDLPGWEKYKPEFYKEDAAPGRKPFIVLGKVVRVEDLGGERYDVGVLFTAVDSGHKLALKKYLEKRKDRIQE